MGETTSNLHFLEVALRAERCVSTAAAPTIINQKEEKILPSSVSFHFLVGR